MIGAGVRDEWLREGDGVRVRGLPTRFGPVGYHMRAVGDTVVVTLAPGLRMPAAGIIIRNPTDLPARRIVVDGRDASADANGDLVLLVLPREVRFEYLSDFFVWRARNGAEGRGLSIGRPRTGRCAHAGMRRHSDRTDGGAAAHSDAACHGRARRSRRRSRHADLFRGSHWRLGIQPRRVRQSGSDGPSVQHAGRHHAADPGTRRFEAQVGIRNLLAHVIGDEQAGAAPPDTMGIFVFFISGPVVTAPSPCAGCQITLSSQHGERMVTAAEPEVLPLAGASRAGGRARRHHALAHDVALRCQCRRHRVPVRGVGQRAVARAGRDAVEGRVPGGLGSGERHRAQVARAADRRLACRGRGRLTITGGPRNFYRRDSIATTGRAYIQATMRYTGSSTTLAEPWLAIDDGARLIALGMRSGAVGFVTASREFSGNDRQREHGGGPPVPAAEVRDRQRGVLRRRRPQWPPPVLDVLDDEHPGRAACDVRQPRVEAGRSGTTSSTRSECPARRHAGQPTTDRDDDAARCRRDVSGRGRHHVQRRRHRSRRGATLGRAAHLAGGFPPRHAHPSIPASDAWHRGGDGHDPDGG